MKKKPLDIFGHELLNALGNGPREPFYHTPGKTLKDGEDFDYSFMCYRATENNKPKAPLEIEISIEQFLADNGILEELNLKESERKVFVIERKYLWIIDHEYELHIIPERTQNPHSDRGYVCHTNITGGKAARHGGELWYGKDSLVFVNNLSGRFYTQDPKEWNAIVKIFISAGYKKVVDIDLKKNSKPQIHE